MRLILVIATLCLLGYLTLGLVSTIKPPVGEDPTPAPKPTFLEQRSAGFGPSETPKPMLLR